MLLVDELDKLADAATEAGFTHYARHLISLSVAIKTGEPVDPAAVSMIMLYVRDRMADAQPQTTLSRLPPWVRSL